MKKSQSTDVNKLALVDVLEENQTFQWITENGKTVFAAFLGILVISIAVYKMAFAGAEKSEYAFINAENDYQLYIAKGQPENLQKLNTLMTAHPELHAKYDALIAQNFISQDKTDQALPYATPSIKRTETENSPFYSAYSQGSLLIGEKNYKEALSQALSLKQLMEKDANGNYGDILYGLNLIRIGMLQKELGLFQDEAVLWQEWKQYASLNKDSPKFNYLMNYFQEGKISLINYIEAREKLIEKH